MHSTEVRRAKLHLTGTHLAHLTGLQDDLRVVGVMAWNDPIAVDLIVEGESLAPITPDDAAPYLRPSEVGVWAS